MRGRGVALCIVLHMIVAAAGCTPSGDDDGAVAPRPAASLVPRAPVSAEPNGTDPVPKQAFDAPVRRRPAIKPGPTAAPTPAGPGGSEL